MLFRSPHELLLVERNDSGRIVAATVVTLQPETLNRRLLWKTSLLRAFMPGALRLWRLVAGGGGGTHAPEMILLFTAPEERRHGRGQSLVRRIDAQLLERGVREYEVRTETDPANVALAFYRRLGFMARRVETRLGVSFQVFARTVLDERQ